MKTEHINIRIESDLKHRLFQRSEETGKKLSEIIRESLIANDYENYSFTAYSGQTCKISDLDTFKSLIFSELIGFMYHKKYDNIDAEIDEFKVELINIIDEIENNPIPDDDAKKEFHLVKEEIKEMLEPTRDKHRYSFPDHINYDAIWGLLCTIRFNSEDEKII